MNQQLSVPAGAPLYECDGRRMTIYEWALVLTRKWRRPVSHTALLNRLRRGWTVRETLSVPIGKRRSSRRVPIRVR